MKEKSTTDIKGSKIDAATHHNNDGQEPALTGGAVGSGYDLWEHFTPGRKPCSDGCPSILDQIDQDLQDFIPVPTEPPPSLEGLEDIEQAARKILTHTERERERIVSACQEGSSSHDAISFSDKYISRLIHFTAAVTKAIRFHGDMTNPHCPSPFRAAVDVPGNNQFVNVAVEPDRVVIYLLSLPKKYAGYNEPIRQLLHTKLYLCHGLPNWKQWSATFVHVYPTVYARSLYAPKDVDNWSYKSVIDEMAFALNASDSAACFDYSATAIFTDNLVSGVYILVTERSEKSFDFSFFQKASPSESEHELCLN